MEKYFHSELYSYRVKQLLTEVEFKVQVILNHIALFSVLYNIGEYILKTGYFSLSDYKISSVNRLSDRSSTECIDYISAEK
jgi:hypothetical protein